MSQPVHAHVCGSACRGQEGASEPCRDVIDGSEPSGMGAIN